MELTDLLLNSLLRLLKADEKQELDSFSKDYMLGWGKYSFAVILSVWRAFQTIEECFGNHMDISTFVHICRCDGFYLPVNNLIL